MGDILLFEELVDQLLEDHEELCVLFGKKDFIEIAGTSYDLMFHYLRGIAVGSVHAEDLRVIPVLKGFEDESTIMNICRLYDENNSLMTFGVRTKNQTIVLNPDGTKGRMDGPYLSFFELRKVEYGLEPVRVKQGFAAASRKRFAEEFPDWDEGMKHIESLKEKIKRNHYS